MRSEKPEGPATQALVPNGFSRVILTLLPKYWKSLQSSLLLYGTLEMPSHPIPILTLMNSKSCATTSMRCSSQSSRNLRPPPQLLDVVYLHEAEAEVPEGVVVEEDWIVSRKCQPRFLFKPPKNRATPSQNVLDSNGHVHHPPSRQWKSTVIPQNPTRLNLQKVQAAAAHRVSIYTAIS